MSKAYELFSQRIATDSRVNAGLTKCVKCDQPLDDARSVLHEGVMLLFAQCPHCKTIHFLDSMTLP